MPRIPTPYGGTVPNWAIELGASPPSGQLVSLGGSAPRRLAELARRLPKVFRAANQRPDIFVRSPVDLAGEGLAGEFSPRASQIRIDPTGGDPFRTLVHEIIHALYGGKVNPPAKYARQIARRYNQAPVADPAYLPEWAMGSPERMSRLWQEAAVEGLAQNLMRRAAP